MTKTVEVLGAIVIIAYFIYALIYLTIKEWIEEARAEKRRKGNLLGADYISLNLSDSEFSNIKKFMQHYDCTSIEQYVRKEIKKARERE